MASHPHPGFASKLRSPGTIPVPLLREPARTLFVPQAARKPEATPATVSEIVVGMRRFTLTGIIHEWIGIAWPLLYAQPLPCGRCATSPPTADCAAGARRQSAI